MVSHARLQELLAYLLLHGNAPVSRQQLAFVFWPDSSEGQARTNLRNLWHRLRRTLPEADRLLATDELTTCSLLDLKWGVVQQFGTAGGD